jgi:hypothetical protein
MSLLLCHHCFTWVEPLGDQCPQCDYPLDARSPDPTPQQLNASIGRIVSRFGEVRISRVDLPGQGTLYETTLGLFFVPHRLEQVKLVRGESAARPFRSMLAAWLTAPLDALRGEPHHQSATRMEVAVDAPRLLGPDDSGQLATLLMQNPGVFFLPRRAIQKVRWTLRGWTISRQNNLTLRMKPTEDRGRFHERMNAWAAQIEEAVCP